MSVLCSTCQSRWWIDTCRICFLNLRWQNAWRTTELFPEISAPAECSWGGPGSPVVTSQLPTTLESRTQSLRWWRYIFRYKAAYIHLCVMCFTVSHKILVTKCDRRTPQFGLIILQIVAIQAGFSRKSTINPVFRMRMEMCSPSTNTTRGIPTVGKRSCHQLWSWSRLRDLGQVGKCIS